MEADQGSLAVKYHHMGGEGELDGLVAQHYGDALAGVGANHSIGGAVWRGDLVATFAEEDTVASVVTSISHSWIWGGKNTSGVAEYFYNGFGRSDGCYSVQCLEESPELLERVARGELFNLGQHYLALGVVIEITPLFQLTPNLFTNLGDPSALAQVVFKNDLQREPAAVERPQPSGSAPTAPSTAAPRPRCPGLYLSQGASASLQLVWYW